MIAVWSPRVARCRSRQETEAFSVPSSNHLIETSPVNVVFLILVGGFIQAMRLASSAQNPSGSAGRAFIASAVAAPDRHKRALRSRRAPGTAGLRMGEYQASEAFLSLDLWPSQPGGVARLMLQPGIRGT